MIDEDQQKELRQKCRAIGVSEVRIWIASGGPNPQKMAIIAAELENMIEDRQDELAKQMRETSEKAVCAAWFGGGAALVSAVAALFSLFKG